MPAVDSAQQASRRRRSRRRASIVSVGIAGRWELAMGQVELRELGLVDGGRALRHQVLPALGLREGDDVAQAAGAAEQHRDAVESQRDAAVWRRTVAERLEQKSELLLGVFFG